MKTMTLKEYVELERAKKGSAAEQLRDRVKLIGSPPTEPWSGPGGKENVDQGRDLETTLKEQCELLRARGRCDVTKKSNPLRILRPLGDGKFVCVKTSAETVDFNGTLAGGRAIYFEAKSTVNRVRFPFSMLRDEQIDFMRRHAELGGLTFVYVASLELGRDYVLPVDGVGRIAGTFHKRCAAESQQPQKPRESIRWDEMARWSLVAGETWHDAVERLQASGVWPVEEESAVGESRSTGRLG